MITFNDKQLPEWVNVVGISFQPLNLSIVEHEVKRRVGNIDSGVEKGGIEINLDLFVEPAEGLSIHDQSDELKRFMRGNKWEVSPLIINEQPHKFYKARVGNVSEITDNFTHGEMTMGFYCANPKKYDVEESTVSSSGGEAVIEYSGLEKAPAKIIVSITTNLTNLELIHEESGRQMTILGQFSSGQTVVIDTDNRTVQINGENAKDKLAFESNWLYLDEGTNTFTCTSPDGITNDFEIKYRTAD